MHCCLKPIPWLMLEAVVWNGQLKNTKHLDNPWADDVPLTHFRTLLNQCEEICTVKLPKHIPTSCEFSLKSSLGSFKEKQNPDIPPWCLQINKSKEPHIQAVHVFFHWWIRCQETFKFLGQLTKELPQVRSIGGVDPWCTPFFLETWSWMNWRI